MLYIISARGGIGKIKKKLSLKFEKFKDSPITNNLGIIL